MILSSLIVSLIHLLIVETYLFQNIRHPALSIQTANPDHINIVIIKLYLNNLIIIDIILFNDTVTVSEITLKLWKSGLYNLQTSLACI